MKKIFFMVLPALLFSCSSDDDNSAAVIPAPTTDAVAYFRGNVDGVLTDYTFNNNSVDYAYGPITGFSGDGFDRWYYYGGMFSPATNFNTWYIIGFNNMYAGNSDESEESAAFYDSVETIPTNYLTSVQDDNRLKGLEISEMSDSQVSYSTMYGSQAGSSFTVTSSSEAVLGSQKTKTITGTYNCKLYTSDGSDVHTITNGSYKIIITEFN